VSGQSPNCWSPLTPGSRSFYLCAQGFWTTGRKMWPTLWWWLVPRKINGFGFTMHFLDEMTHFFSVYKDLESAEVVGKGWEGLERAYEEIKHAVELYRMNFRSLFG